MSHLYRTIVQICISGGPLGPSVTLLETMPVRRRQRKQRCVNGEACIRANVCQERLCDPKSIFEACATEASLAVGKEAPSAVSLADLLHVGCCTILLCVSEIGKANHGVGVSGAGALSRADLPG